jgi:hypothetical protein
MKTDCFACKDGHCAALVKTHCRTEETRAFYKSQEQLDDELLRLYGRAIQNASNDA